MNHRQVLLGGLHRAESANELSGPQKRVMDAAATLRNLGLDRPQKAAVAAMARYSPTSGGYANLLGQLKTAGFIDYPSPGLISLTEQGARHGTPQLGVKRLEDFHTAWMEILSEPQRKLLRVMIARYPDAMLREDLAQEAGYSPTSGGFANLLGQLRTLDVVEYPGRGQVAATELLFPPLPTGRQLMWTKRCWPQTGRPTLCLWERVLRQQEKL